MIEAFRQAIRDARDAGVDIDKIFDEETGRLSRRTRNFISIMLCLTTGGTPILFAILKWHAATKGIPLDLNETALYWAFAGGVTAFITYVTGKTIISKLPALTKQTKKQ